MSARATRILGVDPGLRVTGFGLIEKSGNNLAYVASGCIKTDAKASLPQRLKTIYAGLRELVTQYKPDQAVVEIVFVNVNPQSTLLLGQARGAAICGAVLQARMRRVPVLLVGATSQAEMFIRESQRGIIKPYSPSNEKDE